MNFVAICLHCLDMRDFHSLLRDTPCLDELRNRSIFIPMGRAHGHNNKDSANAELSGQWTARHCNSQLTRDGFVPQTKGWFPKTLLETLADAGYDIITCNGGDQLGNAAIAYMPRVWMTHEPDRAKQFNTHKGAGKAGMLDAIRNSDKFYAHFYLRETHRPWAQNEGLCALVGKPPGKGWPDDAFCARKAALEHPDEFAALRRRGLAMADRVVEQILTATSDRDDITYIIYSNHGEVFDHFRYNLPIINDNDNMIVGVSHGPYPYEILYANMQMWLIPGAKPKTITGIGRMIEYAPTVLDLAGVSPSPMDGQSMLPDFDQGHIPTRDRYAESGLAETGSCISMTRADGFKLLAMNHEPLPAGQQHRTPPDYHKLAVFDLTADPDECNNIIHTDRGQEILTWAIDTHNTLAATRQPPPNL